MPLYGEASVRWHHRWYLAHREEVLSKPPGHHPPRTSGYNRIYSARYRARTRNALGNGITLQEWENIKSEYGYKCAYCGRNESLTLDHIIPLSSGGKHDIDNIVPACEHCNKSKGAKPLLIWMKNCLERPVR